MVVLWLEGYQNEQRKLKGQLCKRFVCKELQKKKDASQKAPLRERWNEFMLISEYFSGALLKADLGWIHPTFVNTSHFPKH